jgi:CHAT domain-containing protein
VRSWLAARARSVSAAKHRAPALVVGPGLPGGRREIAALGRLYPGAVTLGPREACVDAVLAALDGADLAHIAAHGTFRADNPLFSALTLADGPLTVYDLDRLREAPRLLVLPACDIAVSEARAGDELLGLAAAVLRLGSASLVAPVVPIPDEATRPLMVALHRRLLAGDEPPAALAAARGIVRGDDPASRAARSAFLVLGA